MSDLVLQGCRTLPLLSYLKTLGVLRHLGTADPDTRLWWNTSGVAVLRSRFDESAALDFFLDEYVPTPITSPWNGGSGYTPTTSVPGLDLLERSVDPRCAPLGGTIRFARDLISEMGLGAGMKEQQKERFLTRWRAEAPDAALEWLDATLVLEEDGPTMNPLLGTGGNDGRLDFSGNFVTHLTATCLAHVVRSDPTPRRRSRELLSAALFDAPARLERASVGMFDPGGSGLPNSSSSVGDLSIVNPWDFVLMLEGATLFAGSAARRYSFEWALFPFTVGHGRAASIGTSLAASADGGSRGETWLPVWDEPASLAGVKRVMRDGRLQDDRHQSASGRDMVRAASDMGVDRGITRFERVVYAKRNGLAFVAVPVGALPVRAVTAVAVLRGADNWLRGARQVKSNAVESCVELVDRTASEVCLPNASPVALQRWLLALVECEVTLARRPATRATGARTHIPPLSALSRDIASLLPDTVELRLALALAAIGRAPGAFGLRQLLEPVECVRGWRYRWSVDLRPRSSLERPLDLLAELAARSAPEVASVAEPFRARLRDVQRFIAGETDDGLVVRLAAGLTLCSPSWQRRTSDRDPVGAVDRLYAAARLATDDPNRRTSQRSGTQASVGADPAIAPTVVRALVAGNPTAAAGHATRRLRGTATSRSTPSTWLVPTRKPVVGSQRRSRFRSISRVSVR